MRNQRRGKPGVAEGRKPEWGVRGEGSLERRGGITLGSRGGARDSKGEESQG
jgi:hypothetical protein